MSDARRDFYTRSRQCGRCERPFDFGETVYEPGRYETWTWPKLPVCWACSKALEEEAARPKEQDETLRQVMFDAVKAQREKDAAGKKPKEWRT